jgi:hypothetical protein
VAEWDTETVLQDRDTLANPDPSVLTIGGKKSRRVHPAKCNVFSLQDF